jgi:hypothetical protein
MTKIGSGDSNTKYYGDRLRTRQSGLKPRQEGPARTWEVVGTLTPRSWKPALDERGLNIAFLNENVVDHSET